MTTEYTLDQFEIDFKNATTDGKTEVLIKALDNLDVFNPLIKETLLKYKDQLKDIRTQMRIDEDLSCTKDIDSGTLVLYKCLKSYGTKVEGNSYYVKISDLKVNLLQSELVDKYLGDKLIWIYDNRGSQKTKNLFLEGVFSDFFEKV